MSVNQADSMVQEKKKFFQSFANSNTRLGIAHKISNDGQDNEDTGDSVERLQNEKIIDKLKKKLYKQEVSKNNMKNMNFMLPSYHTKTMFKGA